VADAVKISIPGDDGLRRGIDCKISVFESNNNQPKHSKMSDDYCMYI